ncbi:MAG: hypothetical protein ACYSWP_03470 [Planctomycetota bacterium]|jgi:hypothetical protein
MTTTIDKNAFDKTLSNLTERLLDSRVAQGHWRGRLSPSALSTAVAVFALSIVDKAKFESLIQKGLNWLTENQNSELRRRLGRYGNERQQYRHDYALLFCFDNR